MPSILCTQFNLIYCNREIDLKIASAHNFNWTKLKQETEFCLAKGSVSRFGAVILYTYVNGYGILETR